MVSPKVPITSKNEAFIASKMAKGTRILDGNPIENPLATNYKRDTARLQSFTSDEISVKDGQQLNKPALKLTLKTEGLAGGGSPVPQEIKHYQSSDHLIAPNIGSHDLVKASSSVVRSASLPIDLNKSVETQISTEKRMDAAGHANASQKTLVLKDGDHNSLHELTPAVNGAREQKAPFSISPDHIDQSCNNEFNDGSLNRLQTNNTNSQNTTAVPVLNDDKHSLQKGESVFDIQKRSDPVSRNEKIKERNNYGNHKRHGPSWRQFIRVSIKACNIMKVFRNKSSKLNNDDATLRRQYATSAGESNTRTGSSPNEKKTPEDEQSLTITAEDINEVISVERRGPINKNNVPSSNLTGADNENHIELEAVATSHDSRGHSLGGKDAATAIISRSHHLEQAKTERVLNQPRSGFDTDETSTLQDTSTFARLKKRLGRFGSCNRKDSFAPSHVNHNRDDSPENNTSIVATYVGRLLGYLNCVDKLTDRPIH